MMSSLERFKLPAEDTRLLRHDDTIFKIKLCYDSQSPWLPCPQRILHEEVEKVVETAIHLGPALKQVTIATRHFLVRISVKLWKAGRKLEFRQNGVKLKLHENMIMFSVKPKEINQQFFFENEVSSKRTVSARVEDQAGSPEKEHRISNGNARVSFDNEDRNINNNARSSQKSPSAKGKEAEDGVSVVKLVSSRTKSKKSDDDAENAAPTQRSLRPSKRRLQEGVTDDPQPLTRSRARRIGLSPRKPSSQSIDNRTKIRKVHNLDRHVVHQQELEQEMKLQQMARPNSPAIASPALKRRRSSFHMVMDTILTPVKFLLRAGKG